jgi:bifunctional DNA-binding transcriptional regulator/antitoxin component of YhaV-PrlF toxin-antitoxin module
VPTLTLTAKRQATFPLETCQSLGLKPGDRVELEARDDRDGRVWVLRPRPVRARRWIGTLAAYGDAATEHSMDAVRASVATGRKRERAT